MKDIILCVIFAIILGFSFDSAFAQIQQGGVDYPGEWFSGEGLKQGDRFRYEICHVNFKECQPFVIDFWIEGIITDNSEEKWKAQTIIHDGAFILKGHMELGTRVAPETTGGTKELLPYSDAFKSSLVWLSAFATADVGLPGKGPKKFSDVSWGKIANIGGEQILPTAVENIKVQGGTFETVVLSWKTGGVVNNVWIHDDFPFPIKANTFVHVSSGIPPSEYVFELLEYQENVQTDPFADITPILPKDDKASCSDNYDLKSVRQSSENFKYLIDIKYGPENPITGCNIEWFINFKNPFNEDEFLSQVQYDILVTDDDLTLLRSLAGEEGRDFFYSQSGQVHESKLVLEAPGDTNYVIWIYGTSPDYIVPPVDEQDHLKIIIDILDDPDDPFVVPSKPTGVPDWIKTNAGWWADGLIDDFTFIAGIQYLISQDILVISSDVSSSGNSGNVPDWVKTNAGWWAKGLIDDRAFISGIQYLVETGVIRIS